jgi:AraC family ethanolamine operon transcriptional activator
LTSTSVKSVFSPASNFESAQSFSDVDEFSEATRAWDLEISQLERGKFEGKLQQISCGPILLSYTSYNRRVELKASAPAHTRVFGLHSSQPTNWCGMRSNSGDLQTHCGGEEISAITPPGYDVFTVAVDEDFLHSICDRIGTTDVGESGLKPESLSFNPSHIQALYNSAYKKIITGNSEWVLIDPAKRQEWMLALVENICRASALGRMATTAQFETRQSQRMEEVKKYIDYFADQPPSIADLCSAAGVSERSLHYGFLQEFGMTPMAYTKARRIGAVRKALRKSGSCIKVVDIANRWGFWHMGQFAADYRKMFGELPSKTQHDNSESPNSVRD